MKKIGQEPRLAPGPGLFASLVTWAREVALALNTNVDALLGFTVGRTGTSGTIATIAPVNGGNGDAVLALDKTGTTSAAINAYRSGVLRWQILLGNNSAESGANAGSDFAINRFSDVGATLAQAFSILRSNGQVNVAGTFVGASGVQSNGATVGFSANGAFADGSNFGTALMSSNPAWETVNWQAYHVPGSWAGCRWILGTVSPAVFEMRNNGTGYSVGGWVATSDARVKANVQPLGDVLAWIDDVVPCEYDRIDVTNLDGSPVHRAGFIANHFEPHAPTLVMQDKPTDEQPDPIRSLDYDGAGAYLWRAVQQLKAELAEARAEIQTLKGS